MKSGPLGDVTVFRALTMKLVARFGLICVLLALFVTIFVYEVRESPLLGVGRTDDLASVYQPMKVNPADLKPKRPVHTLSGDGEPDDEEAGADSEEEEPAVVDPRSNNEEEESDDTGATTQSRASRDKMAAQDAEEATDDEDDYYPEIHLASVSCGKKRATGNIVTMLRTIATFLESDEYFISVHIICDNEHLEEIRREEILPRSVNHIMYMDADTLFLTPVEDVWKEIHNDLEKKHFIAAVKEYELDDVPDKELTKQMQYKSPVPHFGNSAKSLMIHLPVSPELLLKVLLGSVRQNDCPPKSELFPRIEKLIWAGRLKKQGFEDDMYE
ncbi:unnamed protein product [Notodromas monacha]|uniref:Uncharacterized protein n=1 Tax=Notodromas monacha TaxID=399045 RepID=A0A7R9GJG9_9CRUS|nr:unnamed protein product [Notodromas monacha]CAG0923650.1 unnamed protein product [Notodromas monacha]